MIYETERQCDATKFTLGAEQWSNLYAVIKLLDTSAQTRDQPLSTPVTLNFDL